MSRERRGRGKALNDVHCFMLTKDETHETHDTAWEQFQTAPGASFVGARLIIEAHAESLGVAKVVDQWEVVATYF